MYAIYAYIDPPTHPNVGIYSYTWSVWDGFVPISLSLRTLNLAQTGQRSKRWQLHEQTLAGLRVWAKATSTKALRCMFFDLANNKSTSAWQV